MSGYPSSAAAADAAAGRLRGWLLSGAVQCSGGDHAGGIFGAFDSDGSARYVYPEITGYYLHWLGEVGSEADPAVVRQAAARAADWALRELADGHVPATRAYLGGRAESDWRNQAVFFFDLAMLLRGLCAASEAGLIVNPSIAIARLIEELARFVDAQGNIAAARLLQPTAALPQRWSTLGGPFEVKATSRVILAARHQPLPAALEGACRKFSATQVASAAIIPLDMLHPTLYFAEGMLVAEPASSGAIAALVDRCVKLKRDDGSLPEAQDSPVPRSDIIAQTLRLRLLLSRPDDSACDDFATALVERVGEDGSLAFRPDVASPQPNVWCAMFAEQALRWYARRARGQALPAAEWLV